jgi:DNA-binding Lrp family transcriptional regulator
MKSLSELEKKVIREILGDLEITAEPFKKLARKIRISQEDLLSIIQDLIRRGVIRRFGATLRHRLSGFDANAMVAWMVPEKVDQVGKTMARFREVTHCYWRVPEKDWKYNLFTMVHASSQEECQAIAGRISQATGVEDYILLFSDRELKKTSMKYV